MFYQKYGVKAALSAALVASVFSTGAFASSGLQVQGAMPVKLKLHNGQIKIVRLMTVALSHGVADQLSALATNVMTHSLQTPSQDSGLPSHHYAGMHHQAVLDQGEWGSCATFASSAAVNAAYSLLDTARVSQLCNLEVGRTLNELPGSDGGWQGSYGDIILNQIAQHGYMTLYSQHAAGCGGLKEYPVNSSHNGHAMPLSEFNRFSNHTFTKNDWRPILPYTGSFSPLNPKKGLAALKQVKYSLAKGNPVVFGTLLDSYVGEAGAIGKYKGVDQDTWVMTKTISADIKDGLVAGHEIVIDGYDDKACAAYKTDLGDTKKQCGLLRIRNSWGPDAGYKGDYFMSYDYFKTMVIEAYSVGKNVRKK